MANNFTSASWISVWQFENNGNDEKSNNTLTAHNGAGYTTTNPMRGSYSASLDLTSQTSFYISDGDLSAGFPGKNGVGNKNFSVCGFFRLDTTNAVQIIAGKLNAPSEYCWCVQVRDDRTFRFSIGHGTVLYNTDYDPVIAATTGNEYYFGCTYFAASLECRVYLYDVTNDEHHNTASTFQSNVIASSLNGYPGPYFYIGRYTNAGYLHGQVDEVGIYDGILNETDYDNLRQDLYGGEASSSSSSSVSSSSVSSSSSSVSSS